MDNHEHNDHGHSSEHDNTEGSRQYYPKGWWMPLAGLVTIALGFALLGGTVLGISGTDKWGQSAQHECTEHCGPDCKDKAAGKECHDKDAACEDKHDAHGHEAPMKDEAKKDSAPAADTNKAAHDAPKPEPAHEGHGH